MPETTATVRWLGAVPSTQEVAHLLASDGAPHGTAVAAREQVAGRGTRGRVWHSPIGGLWISVICRPRNPVTAECFSIRVGLAVAEAVESALPGVPPIQLKWPNDLYLDNRKLGGILCEAHWQGGELAWIVAGIGLNVRNALAEEVRATAVALADVAPDATAELLAGPVAERVAGEAVAGGPLEPRELAAFRARDFLWGRRLREPIAGVATGIDASGGLRVNAGPDGIRVALSGTVILA